MAYRICLHHIDQLQSISISNLFYSLVRNNNGPENNCLAEIS